VVRRTSGGLRHQPGGVQAAERVHSCRGTGATITTAKTTTTNIPTESPTSVSQPRQGAERTPARARAATTIQQWVGKPARQKMWFRDEQASGSRRQQQAEAKKHTTTAGNTPSSGALLQSLSPSSRRWRRRRPLRRRDDGDRSPSPPPPPCPRSPSPPPRRGLRDAPPRSWVWDTGGPRPPLPAGPRLECPWPWLSPAPGAGPRAALAGYCHPPAWSLWGCPTAGPGPGPGAGDPRPCCRRDAVGDA
jgi:hypothetical protein